MDGSTIPRLSFDERRPYAAIAKLATPTVFAMLLQSVVNEVDIYFFKLLPHPTSSNSQAALLPSLILVWAFGGSLSAVSVGTQALVARRYAEGDKEAAGAILANVIAFCLVVGALLSILGWVFLPAIARGLHENPAVQDIILRYSRFRLGGIISMGMTMGVKAFFDGIGRTKVHLVSSLVMNVINVALCYFFIFGNGGFPRMEAPGAGFAAFSATWVGLFIMLVYAWSVRAEYKPFRLSKLSFGLTWDILKLSIPAALATIVMMVGFALFTKIAGRLDALDAARVAIGEHVEAVNGAATTDIVGILKLTFTACIAFGTATATLVGQSLGAKNPEAAVRFGWASVRLGLLVFGVVGLCEGVLFTPQVIALVTDSPAVRAAAIVPMRLMGIVTPVIAVAMILSEALFGAGNPKFVAVTQFVLVFLCFLPLAYVLGLLTPLGLMGVWVAACIYSACAAVAMSVKFAKGSWKDIRL